jgi:hypothetical protein
MKRKQGTQGLEKRLMQYSLALMQRHDVSQPRRQAQKAWHSISLKKIA